MARRGHSGRITMIGLVLVVLAGCGGGGGDGGPSDTVSDVIADQNAIARPMLLTVGEVGAGFLNAPAGTDEPLAPLAECQSAQGIGPPIGTASRVFRKTADVLVQGAESRVDLYPDDVAAAAAVEATGKPGFAECLQRVLAEADGFAAGREVRNVASAPPALSGLYDASAIRLVYDFTTTEGPASFYVDFVVFSRGRAVGAVLIGSTPEPYPSTNLETVVDTMYERMADAGRTAAG